MKASRLLSILMLLQARGQMSALALSQALEVSARTIVRDIDQLSAAGVPVYAQRGRQGGFKLREGWSTHLTGLTEPESQALLLAGLPAAATELGLGAAAAGARLKMLASLPAAWRDQAHRVGQCLHIDALDWHRQAEAPEALRTLAQAVWLSRCVQVRYQSWQAQTTKTLEPWGLVLKAGVWYALARTADNPGLRIYRVSNMLEIQSSPQRFKRKPGFDLARAWQSATQQFEAGQYPLQARVWVSPRAMQWLTNARTPCTPLTPRGLAPHPHWRALGLSMESIEHGARQVLGWGGEVQVAQPLALRRRVVALAKAVADLHAGPPPA
jgi:predicted DNA-binding transcriptional regulator YafY